MNQLPPLAELQKVLPARVRIAEPHDGQQILEIFAKSTMEGDLVLATRREPDFFRLYTLQKGKSYPLVYEQNNQVLAAAAFLVRDGFLNNQNCKVGYLGDLRTLAGARKAMAISLTYGSCFESIAEHSGCDLFLTSILASNTQAIRALVNRKGKRRNKQPHYHLLRQFSTCAIHFTFKKRLKPSKYKIVRATRSDIRDIIDFLHRDHSARLFGYRFDQGEFEHRLANWPNYRLENTYMAIDLRHRIVGVTTLWDAKDVKRYQVLAYRGSMKWVKKSFNLGAKLFRFPPLPEEKEVFNYFYLSNLSIENDNPEILKALLHQIYSDNHAKGYHFFTLPLDAEDPLEPAIKGFMARHLWFNLYAVSSSQNPLTDFPATGRTGFELALA